MYVTTFVTDGSALPVLYSQTEHTYIIADRTPVGSGAQGNLILDRGNASGFTNVPFGVAIPSQAQGALLHGVYSTSVPGPNFQVGYLYGEINNVSNAVNMYAYNGTPGSNQLQMSQVTSASFNYTVQASGTDTMSVWAAGFIL
jgi:hypothetical protein